MHLVSSSPIPCIWFPPVLHGASGFLQSYTMHLVSFSPILCIWFPPVLHHASGFRQSYTMHLVSFSPITMHPVSSSHAQCMVSSSPTCIWFPPVLHASGFLQSDTVHLVSLKVHKRENFFGSDFEFYTFL
jgi:hypothetical protein